MKNSILDAALKAFGERGVLAATVDDIRREAGVSVGSVYHHFGDKEGVAAALWLDCLRRYQEGFLAELSRHPDARGGVEGAVRFHLRWCGANPERARFLLAGRPAASVEANREFFAAVQAWLRPHVHYGAVRDLPLDVLHALWLGAAMEYSRHWLAGRVAAPSSRAISVLAEAAWNSIDEGGIS